MVQFAIIEVEDGLTIIEVPAGETPEDAARREGGTLIDAGPYSSYEDAYDAMTEFEGDEDDEPA